MQPCGFWRRLGARLIDILVILPFSGTLMLLAYGNRDLSVISDVTVNFTTQAYFVLCTYRWGQTAGKMVVGAKVLAMDGKALTFVQALLRSSVEIGLAFLITGLTVLGRLSISPERYASLGFFESAKAVAEAVPQLHLVNGLNLLWWVAASLTLVFHPLKRSLHDLIAGTRVVRPGVPAAVVLPVTAAPAPAPEDFR